MATTSTPAWSAPHSGLLGDASAIAGSAQVNQFLGTHADDLIYQGKSILTPSGTGGTNWGFQLSTRDIDQPFTMSGTAIGRAQIPLLPVGNGADLLVSLCQDNGGTPGTVVTQTRIPASWIYQVAAASAASAPSTQAPAPGLTGNTLAVPQFNTLHMGATAVNNWPYPTSGTGGPANGPSSTYYPGYFIQIGGTNGGSTFYDNVYTIPFGATLDAAVAQTAFPSVTDGSLSAVVSADPSSGALTIVTCGGLESSSGSPVSSVYAAAFDATTGAIASWSQQTSLPYGTNLAGMAAYNGYVYVLGGPYSGPVGSTTANVYYAQVSNGQVGSWTAGTSLPMALSGFFATAVNGFLFVIGGLDNNAAAHNSVYYASINSNGSLGPWITGPSLPATLYQLSGTAALLANDSGIIVNGNSQLSMLGVGTSGPDASWQTANFGSGGNFLALTSGSAEWEYFGLYGTFYSYTQIALTPRLSVPLPASGLTNGATYHLLLQQQGGDLNNYLCTHDDYHVFSGNPTLLESSRGAFSWTSGAGGHAVPVQLYDQTVPSQGALPWHTWEDGGAKITTLVNATTPDQRFLGICEATQLSQAQNANTGFQSGIAPWTVSGGSAVQESSFYFEGGYSAQVTPSGSASVVYLQSEMLPCMPGQSITVDGRLWFTSAVTSNASMSVNWYTLAGAYISTSSNNVSVSAATWTELSNVFTAPAGAFQYTINPALSGTPAASNVFYVDLARGYPTTVGPQNSTVTQVNYSGTGWPNVGEPTGTTQLA